MGCLGCWEFGCSRRSSAGTFILLTPSIITTIPCPPPSFLSFKTILSPNCVATTTTKKHFSRRPMLKKFHGVLPRLVQSN